MQTIMKSTFDLPHISSQHMKTTHCTCTILLSVSFINSENMAKASYNLEGEKGKDDGKYTIPTHTIIILFQSSVILREIMTYVQRRIISVNDMYVMPYIPL